jgi:hypothetical protein
MYNDDIDGVTIDPLGQDVHAGQSRTPPTRRYNKRVGNVWSARLVLMGVPKAERDRQGIDADRRPPGGLVAVAMEFAVMKAANWDGEAHRLTGMFPFFCGESSALKRCRASGMIRSTAAKPVLPPQGGAPAALCASRRAEVSLPPIQRLETVDRVPPSRSSTLLDVKAALRPPALNSLGRRANGPDIRLRPAEI